MTNTELLKEKIEQSGYKLKYVAAQLGITYYGFLKKINNETEFKASEIKTLCCLRLQRQKKNRFFLPKL